MRWRPRPPGGAGARCLVPGPSSPSASGATAAPPFGRSQGRGTARHQRQGCGHGHCAGAGALGRGVFPACATAAYALAGVVGLARVAIVLPNSDDDAGKNVGSFLPLSFTLGKTGAFFHGTQS